MAQPKSQLTDDDLRFFSAQPEFRKLSSDAQDRILDRYEQETYGSIPKSNNILENMGKIAQQAGQEAFGQASQFAQGFTSEATLGAPEVISHFGGPNIMTEPSSTGQKIARGAGRLGGFALGAPARIGTKVVSKVPNIFLRGTLRGGASMASLSPASLLTGDSDIPTEATKIGVGAGLGGPLESVIPKTGELFFRKNIKAHRVRELGKELEAEKARVGADPNAMVEVRPIVDRLQKVYENLAGPLKEEASDIKTWIDSLKQYGNYVHADILRQMEDTFGAMAKYTSQKGGFMQYLKKPSSPEVNRSFQQARTVASEFYENVAGTRFRQASREISSLLKKYPDLDPSKARGGFITDFAGAVAASHLAPPGLKFPIGAATYTAERLARSPAIKESMFQFTRRPGVQKFASVTGKGIKAGLSEATRTVLRKEQ